MATKITLLTNFRPRVELVRDAICFFSLNIFISYSTQHTSNMLYENI